MKMRVADYITDALYKAGGKHVFLVTGGMIMHLTDALLQHKKQSYICCHHEQAAAMAADAYGRFTGELGVAYVTAGPGALNTITGVVGAYVDSAPCIVVAGQSKVSQAKVTAPRQFALQGFNNIALLKQITKYAVMFEDVSQVKYEVEKCIYIAKQHRVGPVYLECPIDLQGAQFDPDKYSGFTPSKKASYDRKKLKQQVKKVAQAIRKSSRPCVLAGAGVRLSGAVNFLRSFIEKANIPIVTARLGMDLIEFDHKLYVGHPGNYGDRPANFAIQNSDLILNIGCRLGIGLVGYDFNNFGKRAFKISVDIDAEELKKPSVILDLAIQADAKDFLELLIKELKKYSCNNIAWVSQTQQWKEKYPVDLPEYKNETEGINSYHFMRVFSEKMTKKDVFVLDTGSCFHVHAQAFKVKNGQRHIVTGGLSTMGYMPAVIGVAAVNKGKDVYCITGDGSIQMNLQELQTIVHNKLPAKIIILNNNGYLLIRHTHNNFQNGRLIGESEKTGVGFPDMRKIAKAYGIHFIRINKHSHLDTKIEELKDFKGPVICEVMTPAWQLLIPRISSKKLKNGQMVSMAYDDMYPFLPRDEYEANCVYNKI